MTIDWAQFTPGHSLLGGAMIGAAAALLWFGIGRTAGISGIVGGVLRLPPGDRAWRLALVAGLMVSPWLVHPAAPRIETGSTALILAGLLVGYGTRLGNGCTSGHGVCGLARLSPRSAAAVAVFMAVGFMTVALVRHGAAWL